MENKIKPSDIIDWWKNGTDKVEKVLIILLGLSLLCLTVGTIGKLFI